MVIYEPTKAPIFMTLRLLIGCGKTKLRLQHMGLTRFSGSGKIRDCAKRLRTKWVGPLDAAPMLRGSMLMLGHNCVSQGLLGVG